MSSRENYYLARCIDQSLEVELPAVKQSSCIDKHPPCFVLVSYHMLKSWAVKGYITL